MKYAVSLFLIFTLFCSCDRKNSITPYKDLSHYSNVFGHDKSYRLYLPDEYSTSGMSYPVIYFFHGWGGRHFKDDNAKLDYERIDELVQKENVILVMWDGNIEESEPRPYNIGNPEDVKYQVQFKDYFPELVGFIDSTYRTLTGRSNRGIIGYSMGGIMSWFLSGKYPHMIGAAVNMTGSPEFFMGYPENHTLYSLRHTFGNLHGVNLRFHNSTTGELVYLNREVHQGALREDGLSYIYQEYEGGHKVDLPGEITVFKDAFDFIVASFKEPLPRPTTWNHVDLYPEFDIWDYHISSNLDEPGYIVMENVSESGMKISTKKWLPAGPPVPGVKIKVQTAPVYDPGLTYNIFLFHGGMKQGVSNRVKCDSLGRISFKVSHACNHIGIFEDQGPPDPVLLDYRLDGHFLPENKPANLDLQILNRGGTKCEDLTLILSTDNPDVKIKSSEIRGVDIPSGGVIDLQDAFEILADVKPPEDASPWRIRFYLTSTDLLGNSRKEKFEVPVFFDVPAFTEISIDDGSAVIPGGPVLGKGNGNGIPEAGENIMIYSGDHRTRLYYEDKFVSSDDEELYDEMLPSAWPDGITLNSIIKIAEDCPDGHILDLLVSYESKEHMPIKRNVHWGKVLLKIKSK